MKPDPIKEWLARQTDTGAKSAREWAAKYNSEQHNWSVCERTMRRALDSYYHVGHGRYQLSLSTETEQVNQGETMAVPLITRMNSIEMKLESIETLLLNHSRLQESISEIKRFVGIDNSDSKSVSKPIEPVSRPVSKPAKLTSSERIRQQRELRAQKTLRLARTAMLSEGTVSPQIGKRIWETIQAHNDKFTIKQIAKECKVHQANVSVALRDLLKQGKIGREEQIWYVIPSKRDEKPKDAASSEATATPMNPMARRIPKPWAPKKVKKVAATVKRRTSKR